MTGKLLEMRITRTTVKLKYILVLKTKQADGSEPNGSCLCIENDILELGTVLTILNIQFKT